MRTSKLKLMEFDLRKAKNCRTGSNQVVRRKRGADEYEKFMRDLSNFLKCSEFRRQSVK
jgi:hypothetical protein